jgi:MFS family permease
MQSGCHKIRTLWLCGVLHGFTHVYQVALLPLYLLIQADFKLQSVGQATLFMTVMMFAYFVPSYGMGILADRMSRARLLGMGLAINGTGFVGLALAPNYWCAVGSVIVAGVGGSFFHPAATALVARLFPGGTGKALGLLGIGASVGFFFGPIYSGWRAETAGWRTPVLELGLAGIVVAGLFAWLANDQQEAAVNSQAGTRTEPLFPTPALWWFFIAASFVFGLRDFAGSSMGTLGSLFLQKAHGFTLKETGMALSGIFLAGIISNPLFGHLSDRGRIRWTFVALLVAAIAVAVFPRIPPGLLTVAFAVYGFFFMASYPMVEAALMESVPDAARGRVFGLFITGGGLIGNLSHWLAGRWVKGLGTSATSANSYYPLYGILCLFVLISLLGLPCLHAIRKREKLYPASVVHASPAATLTNPQFE